ncbi:MAG: hypothetical protein EON59_00805 [Alphaproteobacteria bacterium]|nr:MAG: hypothetical protein EON59_00805 [Alphaproteobacteria bacterium]
MNSAELYSSFVRWIGDGTGYADIVLHIHGGMIVLLLARVASGRSLATPWPLLMVLIAAVAKEIADFLAYDRVKPDTWSDIAHTVFWPCVLFIGLRLRRARTEQDV